MDDLDLGKEHFWVVGLNTQLQIRYVDLISMGSVYFTIVTPIQVYQTAICKGVCDLVLAHLHPSGDKTPSKKDIETTKKLIEAGEILDITVHDHIILAPDGSYFSFYENNLI